MPFKPCVTLLPTADPISTSFFYLLQSGKKRNISVYTTMSSRHQYTVNTHVYTHTEKHACVRCLSVAHGKLTDRRRHLSTWHFIVQFR